MTTWKPGRTYDYYGTPLVCVARRFDGRLEAAVASCDRCGRVVTEEQVEVAR